MVSSDILFFSPEDNVTDDQPKKEVKKPSLNGYISTSGKLVFPAKTIDQLGLDTTALFRLGTDAGKRKIKTLYVVPTDKSASDAFTLEKGAKSHYIELGALLKNNGVDFASTKYTFSIASFDYQGQVTAYALSLKAEAADEVKKQKAPYMGKPRGRKKKV